jgi:hypothetical protein
VSVAVEDKLEHRTDSRFGPRRHGGFREGPGQGILDQATRHGHRPLTFVWFKTKQSSEALASLLACFNGSDPRVEEGGSVAWRE